MGRQKIYCEVDFFEKFVESRPDVVLPTEENIGKHENWIRFFKFLNNSGIYFDDAKRYKELALENEIFKILWKQSIQNPSKLDFLGEKYPSINSLNENLPGHNLLTSVFLTATKKKESCEDAMDRFGVLVLNNETVYDKKELYEQYVETIETDRDPESGWEFLETPKFPCNSLCLSDNYIFSDEVKLEYNLLPILDYLLPEESEVEFHITIFTLKTNQETGEDLNLREKSALLKKKIREIRPNRFKFSVSIIFSNRRNYHDRMILTNNLIIQSGSGFDFIQVDHNGGLRIKHRTTVSRSHPTLFPRGYVEREGVEVDLYDFLIEKMVEDFNSFKSYVEKQGWNLSLKNRLLERNN